MADTTLARIFWDRVEKSAARPAQQFKSRGAWQTLTWREVGEAVVAFELGVVQGLVGRGRLVAVVGHLDDQGVALVVGAHGS